METFVFKPVKHDLEMWEHGAKNCRIYACLYLVVFIAITIFVARTGIFIDLIPISIEKVMGGRIAGILICIPALIFLLIWAFLFYKSFIGLYGYARYNSLRSQFQRTRLTIDETNRCITFDDGNVQQSVYSEDIKAWVSYDRFPSSILQVRTAKSIDPDKEFGFCKKDVLILKNGKKITLYNVFNRAVHAYLVENRYVLHLPKIQYEWITVLYTIHPFKKSGTVVDVDTTLL